MTPAQRIVLIAGLFIVLGMALFPPWLFVFQPSQGGMSETFPKMTRPAGYHLVFSPHVVEDQTQLARVFSLPLLPLRYFSVVIDRDRLTVQIGGALAVILILTLLLKPRS